MIEMLVRGVGRDRDSGRALVRLEAPNLGPKATLALPLPNAEAHALAHELRGQGTLRGQAFVLLDRVVTRLGATVSAVEIVPSGADGAIARLRLERPEGGLELPVELGQVLGLSVARRIPVLVSKALLAPAEAPAADASELAPAGSVEVPEAFLRAFAD